MVRIKNIYQRYGELGLATVTTLGLKDQEKETVLLKPSWKLDPWKKDQLTEAVAIEKGTRVKTSLQQDGSQGNKYSDVFLFCSDLLPNLLSTNPNGSQGEQSWVMPYINVGISGNGARHRSAKNNVEQM